MIKSVDIENTAKKILSNEYEKTDLIELLSITEEKQLEELFCIADKVSRYVYSDSVFIRGIIEFSNYCNKDCTYCGIRNSNKDLERFRMEPDEIIRLALAAKNYGYATIVLQSGEEKYYDDKFEYIIKAIKKENKDNFAITLSIGEKPRSLLEKWFDAGADRFLLRIETTDQKLYKKLHPNSDFAKRIEALNNLKEIGYEVGTGIMVGLPGQDLESIADDLLFFKKIDAHMIGIGPFLPHKSTPLWQYESADFNLTLKTLALIRLVLPCANIPATTAMGTKDPLGRQKALRCGANVIMPNFTPQKYRPQYTLYDNKICVNESSDDCRGCVELIAKYANKKIVRGLGTNNLKKIVVDDIFKDSK